MSPTQEGTGYPGGFRPDATPEDPYPQVIPLLNDACVFQAYTTLMANPYIPLSSIPIYSPDIGFIGGDINLAY
jgi:hypothetical protein